MKRSVVNVIVAVACIAIIATAHVLRVVSRLNAREAEIKRALLAAPPGTSLSNDPDGAERFIKTGNLILHKAYLLNPSKIEKSSMLHMRLDPRVTTHGGDGWVGNENGDWYVKIY